MIEIVEREGSVIFGVHVVPRASRDGIEGEHAGALKVRVTAPPIEDRANEAVRRLLARCLNVPVAAVRIVAGERSKAKRIEVAGATALQILSLCATRQSNRK